MNVVYDVSVLGLGLYDRRAYTGVARFVESLWMALLVRDDIDVTTCAYNSLEEYVQLHLNHDAIAGFDLATLAPPQSILARLAAQTLGPFYPAAAKAEVNSLRFRVLSGLLSSVNKLSGGCVNTDMCGQDVFHSTFYPLPMFNSYQAAIKRVLTIHDLIILRFPNSFSTAQKELFQKTISSIGPEDWIITNSESTKNDVCEFLKLDPSRISVTPLAASNLFRPCHDFEALKAVKSRYGVPEEEDYILSVCTFEPRKNLDLLVRSYSQLMEEQGIEGLNLVLVGAKGWHFDKVIHELDNTPKLRKKILVTGYVPDQDLAVLYSAAMMFVYPSLYEGFGLPPLEAMQCGVPVITSNTSSLPQIVGDAGKTFDPAQCDELSQAILEVFSQPDLRKEMSLKSLERSRLFSWENCADQTVKAYEMALDS